MTDLERLGNLSVSQQRHLAIPLRRAAHHHGLVRFKQCTQYDVNFTDVYVNNGFEWPAGPEPDWAETFCKEGWVYDRSEFKNTLVTEVRDILEWSERGR